MTLWAYIDLSNNGSWSGDVLITGCPYTNNSTTAPTGSVIFDNVTYDGQANSYMSSSDDDIKILISKTGTAMDVLDWSGVSDTARFWITLTHFI